MFCTYVLHKRHGKFYDVYSKIIFLNNVGETILFNSVGKISHVFGHKPDILEPNMTVSIFLPCSVLFFLILLLLSLRGKIDINISDAMLIFVLNIPHAMPMFASYNDL